VREEFSLCKQRQCGAVFQVVLGTAALTSSSARNYAVAIYLLTLRWRLTKYRLRFCLHNSRVSAGNKHWHLITCVWGVARMFHAPCLCLLAVGLCLLMFSKQTQPSWGDRAVIIVVDWSSVLAVGQA
jgi:hypothetical protein